ncbi:MAG: phosphoglycerate dehydrogenase [Flavobacteriaceae bacterium]|nr:phosphoglycerate dehydrogenase [Flavobacteriaceae bacterium]
MKILLTSTSFQDTPGRHQDLLYSQGFDIDTLRGPIWEEELLQIIADYDAVICGDDDYTEAVIKKGVSGKLKYISKYGVGLDRIDLKAAEKYGIPVTNCPGVNQVSVAEHVLALLFTFEKNIHVQHISTQSGSWKRWVGNEVAGKTLGIIGLGAIGKELAKKAAALGLHIIAFDVYKDQAFLDQNKEVQFKEDVVDIYKTADIISLHVPHTESTDKMIDEKVLFESLGKQPIIINTSRGKLVDSNAIKNALIAGKIRGYLADVLATEPMAEDEILRGVENVIITPHVGSRTYQSVVRQGTMAVENLLNLINESK